MNILQSASKIVFILLTLTACVGFILGIIAKFLHPESNAGLPVDQFMLLAVAASSFYFSNKGEPQAPFAGK